MTLPRTLELKKMGDSWRMVNQPVEELKTLRGVQSGMGQMTLNESMSLNEMTGMKTTLSELVLKIDLEKTTATHFGIALNNNKGDVYKIGFDKKSNRFYSDRRMAGKKDFSNTFAETIHYAPRESKSSTIDFHLFFDVSSVDMFADNGLTAITDLFFPNEDFTEMNIFVEEGTLEIINGQLYELNKVW